ncbi:MAG TPA: hypothetical protein PKN80_00795 [bacterium]|nr:hypothetical protein [bacterium]HNS48502.1 hypothetical protein [bacterium]
MNPGSRRLGIFAGLLLTLTGAAGAWGQTANTDPSAGYVYPAGGRRGATVQVTVGGQNLRGLSAAYISGDGVSAANLRYIPPLTSLQKDALRRRITAIREKRRAEAAARRGLPVPPVKQPEAETEPAKPVELPDHPLLRDLDNLSNEDLKKAYEIFLDPGRKQPVKRSIQELAILDLSIAEDAPAGDRELRLLAAGGLTNPLRFQVGPAPEILETEPNDPDAPAGTAVELPAVFNGQIMPGDSDCFTFKARRGQKLVLRAQARSLIPYLADAVPGWFQAAIAIYDPDGREAAFADHYRFDPDPVILYEVPRDGEYRVEIRDSIYRGREDFVYRLYAGESPFVTRVFPLGGRAALPTAAALSGWNLPESRLPLDTNFEPGTIRTVSFINNGQISNPVLYSVDNLPESIESESGSSAAAQKVRLPQIINGRIGKPGDTDRFQFEGRSGFEFVAEVMARRLGSPLDSRLRLMDASGRVLAWNDDREDRGSGLNTHHADSYLSFKLPRDGTYQVEIADSQDHGGEEYAYRLRIGPRIPGFELRVTPSSLAIPAGCVTPINVHALRRDGFDGEIEMLLKEAPAGWILNGGLIPAGRESARMTLSAPREPSPEPFFLQLEGRALVNGQPVSRPAVPAEDMMQAFAYRHLVPSETLLALVPQARLRRPAFELAEPGPVNLQAGGMVRVSARVPPRLHLASCSLSLVDPPRGISLGEVNLSSGLLTFMLKSGANEVQPGLVDNLIVEAFTEWPSGPPDEKGNRPKRRVSLGMLPAISIRVTPP